MILGDGNINLKKNNGIRGMIPRVWTLCKRSRKSDSLHTFRKVYLRCIFIDRFKIFQNIPETCEFDKHL